MLAHLRRRAARDDLAEVEHDDVAGDVHHHAHVVLDEQHRDAPLFLHVEDEARHVFGLFAVHAGDGFVEHQHARPHGQRARQFDALLQAVGQRVDGAMADVVDLEEVDDAALDLGTQRVFFIARAPATGQRRQQAGRHGVVAAELDVLEHREAAKQRDVLEGARQAHCGAAMHRCGGDVLAAEPHAACGRAIEARDGVEDAGLARAVGPDDGRDLARRSVKGNTAQRMDATEAQVHAIDPQRQAGSRCCGARLVHR